MSLWNINANFIRPVTEGFVEGIVKPIHIGAATHLWEIKIFNEQKKMNCIARLTMAVLDKNFSNKK